MTDYWGHLIPPIRAGSPKYTNVSKSIQLHRNSSMKGELKEYTNVKVFNSMKTLLWKVDHKSTRK